MTFDCRSTSITGSVVYGEALSPGGPSTRCFSGTFIQRQAVRSGDPLTNHSSCLTYSCTPQQQLVVTVYTSPTTTMTINCPSDGGSVVVDPTGNTFLGSINCPPRTTLCTGMCHAK